MFGLVLCMVCMNSLWWFFYMLMLLGEGVCMLKVIICSGVIGVVDVVKVSVSVRVVSS